MEQGSFNAEAHFKQTLRSANTGLKDILTLDNRLFAECKQLDNDLQTLVHANYGTFIEAADTISQLCTQLKSLDSDLDTLQTSLEAS